MTAEHFEVVENYVHLKGTVKSADEGCKLIQEEVMAVVAEAGGKLEANNATLSLATRKKFVYSSRVTELEDALKQAKKDEETDGIAECTESTYLICKVAG